nr:MAG TPA: hypothetical protein [Caudoviricetes sp.]
MQKLFWCNFGVKQAKTHKKSGLPKPRKPASVKGWAV